MSRWPTIVKCLMVIIALAVIAGLLPKEPSYHGKTLSTWLFDPPNDQVQQTALRTMGPRCVPFIVAKIGERESLFRRLYSSAFEKLPSKVRNSVPNLLRFRSYLTPPEGGILLSYFGPAIVPELVNLTKSPKSVIREAAVTALGRIGVQQTPQVFPALKWVLANDQNADVKSAALSAILRCGVQVKVVESELVTGSNSSPPPPARAR
ncbi:MAG: HEAT repeat domain-containing protein [Limisphaerales bacterium]